MHDSNCYVRVPMVLYRFGFGGKEKDNDVYGNGNAMDFGARIYDARIGKWFSSDPLSNRFPWQSPYNGFDNDPINIIDPTGMGGEYITNDDGSVTVRITVNLYRDPNSKITDEQFNQFATDLKTNCEIVLNRPDPNGDVKYITDANGVRRIVRNFEIQVVRNTFNEVKEMADKNSNPAVNYFLLTEPPEGTSGGGTARGGNAGVLFTTSTPEQQAHEIATTLTTSYSNNPSDNGHAPDGSQSVMMGNAPAGTTLTAKDCRALKVNTTCNPPKKNVYSGMTNNLYTDESIKEWLKDPSVNPHPINKNKYNDYGKKESIYN